MKKALDKQVGGNHYKDLTIQPVEFCQRNGFNYCEAAAIKYICRHREKNGRQDIEKAVHYLELLLDLEYPQEPPKEPGLFSQMEIVQDGAYVFDSFQFYTLEKSGISFNDKLKVAFLTEGVSISMCDRIKCVEPAHVVLRCKDNPDIASHTCPKHLLDFLGKHGSQVEIFSIIEQ